MSKGYNTTAPHTLKEQAVKIMAERCHKGVRMAQIMPSLTWLDVKVFKESGVYDTRTDFFAYEWDEGKRGERKDVFWNICPERYYDIFQQSYLTHFDYSDKDITGNDESTKYRLKKSGSHRPIVKFDLGFYDLCACYYRFPIWFTAEHWHRFTRDADILFTFDLDKNGRVASKDNFSTLIKNHFSDIVCPKKDPLVMFELWENHNEEKLKNKVNSIINCMRTKGLFTDKVCVYQDCGSVMGVFHCKKIRNFFNKTI